MAMQATLRGSLLYIGTRLWADDVDAQEAAEIIADLADMPNAPTGVRIMTTVKHKRKTGTGWPK